MVATILVRWLTLFGYTFVVGLFCIKVKTEGHGRVECYSEGALVFGGHVEGGKWCPVLFELVEESPLDCRKGGMYNSVRASCGV